MSLFSLSKSEILSSKKSIDDLFKTGKSFSEGNFKIIYKFIKSDLVPTSQVLFSAPKRYHPKAVRRNRIKRLMREAYRLNKQELHNWLVIHKQQCLFVILFTGSEKPDFTQFEYTINNLLIRLIDQGQKQQIKQ